MATLIFILICCTWNHTRLTLSPTHSLESFPLTLMSADSEFDVPTAGQSETVLAPLPANHLYTSIRRRRRRRRCCWCCSVLPRDVARCAGEGGEDGANGGLETVRLAGWVVRLGGAAGMTKCSRGMQGVKGGCRYPMH